MFEQEMAGKNDEALVYPKYRAPVVIVQDGVRELATWAGAYRRRSRRWRRAKNPSGRVINVRYRRSGHWRSWLAAPAVSVGKDKLWGGRCIVPTTMFAEPDRNTAKPVVNRWFGRVDGLPFFFAGIWREWQGDVGTIK